MQKINLKFKAPKNKDILIKYMDNKQVYSGYVIMDIELDFIKDFAKNDYMNFVRKAKNEKIKSVYYSNGVIQLDFSQIITNIEYHNILKKKGKSLVNHKNRNKYENDGIFITDSEYYLKSKVIRGYDLKYPEHLMGPQKIVARFLSLLEKEEEYRVKKKGEILEKIDEELKYYKVKMVYNLENQIIIDDENEDKTKEIYLDDKVRLKDILSNNWYYVVENIDFNQKSEIYYYKDYIIFDFRQLKSNLAFINILESEKDFIYEENKKYLFNIINDKPSSYIYLYYKNEYKLDEYEKEFSTKKKLRLFMDEFKRMKRFFDITDYRNSSESENAYKLAEEALTKLNVKGRNIFSKKANYFISELLFPLILIIVSVLFLVYIILYVYSKILI